MAARALTCLSLCLISLLSFAEVDRGVDAYERGKHSVALRYWMPLARNGNALAQNNLGVMYQRGLGVAQDFRKAHSWFEKAAAQDLAEANVNLGLLYFDGLGVSQDQQKAFSLFSIAARDKLPEAYHMLGLQLYSGTGVPVDPSTTRPESDHGSWAKAGVARRISPRTSAHNARSREPLPIGVDSLEIGRAHV